MHRRHASVSRSNWSGFQLARTVSGSGVTNELVRPRTKCSSESGESCEEQELNGLEEGEDAMTDEEREGEGDGGTADWRVSRSKKPNLLKEKRKNTKQHTRRSAIGAHTA